MTTESLFNKEHPLSDLVSFVGDKIPASEISCDNYISTDNMLVDRGGVEPAIKLPAVSKFNHFKPSDTLFSNIRTYFRKVWLANFEGGASPDVLIFRTNDAEILDPIYLYYIISNKNFADYTVLTAKGVKMPRGDKVAIMQYKFYLPEPDKQKFIAQTLRSLDDKIENNRKINETLEGMAQAVFKSWFVDFEPTKAKMAVIEAGGSKQDANLAAMQAISGKSLDELEQMRKNHPESYKELNTTASLFPSAMQDSELGQIPDGWEVASLKDVTTEIRRGISPKYTEDGGVCVINQKCIRGHTINFSPARRNDPEKRKIDGREIKIGDVLVNSTGVGTLGRLAPVRHLPETTVFDSHVTIVRADTDKITKSFLIGLMITKESYIEASGAGSTGQTELRKQILEEISICKPDEHLLKFFEQAVWPCHAKIAVLEQENLTLTQTRDALLTKLLSGEIDVGDVEHKTKETTS